MTGNVRDPMMVNSHSDQATAAMRDKS